ncbi:MAG TPA: hypothetical protein VK358_07830, partial [Longimicrobium sp.]|nr:hypothetical protein [Longimicrobium sp.]
IFLAAEVTRRYLANRAMRQWEHQLRDIELERADQLAGVIDRLCAAVLPTASGRLAPEHLPAVLLQGIVDAVRATAGIGQGVHLHASLLVPESRRERRRQVPYLRIISMNRLAERRGWASFKVDARGPAQDTYRDGRVRVVDDTAAGSVRSVFKGGSFRSIITLPVTLRCLGGQRIAIVSIDASEPGVFPEALVRARLEQATGPHLKLIALSLVLARGNS